MPKPWEAITTHSPQSTPLCNGFSLPSMVKVHGSLFLVLSSMNSLRSCHLYRNAGAKRLIKPRTKNLTETPAPSNRCPVRFSCPNRNSLPSMVRVECANQGLATQLKDTIIRPSISPKALDKAPLHGFGVVGCIFYRAVIRLVGPHPKGREVVHVESHAPLIA